MNKEKIYKNSDTHPPNIVMSVVKALNILDCFTITRSQLSLAQLSTQMSYPKSTTLNLVRTLESSGYLLKDPITQNYSLGYKILNLSYLLRSSIPVIQYALPFLEDIQKNSGEIVYLTSHINGQVLYLEGIYPSRRMTNYSISGKTLPMHCTGCGKAMLAYLPEQQQKEIILRWGLTKMTPNTITNEEALNEEIKLIRSCGYAIDMEEESPNVKCVAVPVLDSNGYPVAAVSISGTVMNMKDSLLNDYAKMLSRTCSLLSAKASEFPAALLS